VDSNCQQKSHQCISCSSNHPSGPKEQVFSCSLPSLRKILKGDIENRDILPDLRFKGKLFWQDFSSKKEIVGGTESDFTFQGLSGRKGCVVGFRRQKNVTKLFLQHDCPNHKNMEKKNSNSYNVLITHYPSAIILRDSVC
jgi:hypothetical protein